MAGTGPESLGSTAVINFFLEDRQIEIIKNRFSLKNCLTKAEKFM